MHPISEFPRSVPLEQAHISIVQPFLIAHRDGVSELSMASLYPFTAKRNYRVFSYTNNHKEMCFGFTGIDVTEEGVRTYAFLPDGYPGTLVAHQLFTMVDEINTIGTTTYQSWKEGLAAYHPSLEIVEDRDNADYLYDRQSLVELVGQSLHKKLAHAQKFAEDHPERILIPSRICEPDDMIEVLHRWAEGKDNVEDLHATEIAIAHQKELGLEGAVLYTKDTPVAFTLGEYDGPNRFIIHIEKALTEYRGVYQYINRAFAASLPDFVTEINREQDLGIPGLRQAKLTYKPKDFVMKYRILIPRS